MKALTFITTIILIAASLPCLADAYSESKTPLYQAAEQGDVILMTKLLDSGANPNQRNPLSTYSHSEDLPIFAALHSARGNTLSLLVNRGANLSLTSSRGYSILHSAVYYNADIVKYLIRNGAKPNVNYKSVVPDDSGTPLHYAVKYAVSRRLNQQWSMESRNIVEYLINAGANINEKRPLDELTPLHIAVKGNDFGLVRYLVDRGANPDIKNREGLTPYCESLWTGNEEIQKFLLSRSYFKESESCYSKYRMARVKSFGEESVRFFKYMWIPLTYTGISLWMFEKKYKANRSDNRMGSFNAYATAIPFGAAAGGLLGFMLTPSGDGWLGGLNKIPGLFFGALVGAPVMAYVAYRNHWGKHFREKRGLYYLTPATATSITLIAYTTSF